MVDKTPAIASTFQAVEWGKVNKGTSVSCLLRNFTEVHKTLLLMSHGPELKSMVTPSRKGGWECDIQLFIPKGNMARYELSISY